jgi:centractin
VLALCVFSVGRPKHVKVMATGAAEGELFVGDKARDLRGILRLTYPTQHGIITDWEDMHAVWQHMYHELSIVQDQHPVLLTESPLNPKSNRGKAAEIFFETFNVPALYVQVQAILSLSVKDQHTRRSTALISTCVHRAHLDEQWLTLIRLFMVLSSVRYASGRTTGVVLDSGDGVTSCVPVYEGFTLPNSITRIDVGGRDVTDYLQLLLRKNNGVNLYTSAEREVVKEIKEKICYVAYNIDNYEKEYSSDSKHLVDSTLGADELEPEIPYKLPDGSILHVGSEKFRAPELLFNPSLIGLEYPGIHQTLVNCISKCDLDLRRTLYSHITLSGGSTLFDGFGDRLLSEVRRLAPRDTKIKIWAPPDRILSTWIGGSILASLATFKKMWVTKKEYEEGGKNAIYRKMF